MDKLDKPLDSLVKESRQEKAKKGKEAAAKKKKNLTKKTSGGAAGKKKATPAKGGKAKAKTPPAKKKDTPAKGRGGAAKGKGAATKGKGAAAKGKGAAATKATKGKTPKKPARHDPLAGKKAKPKPKAKAQQHVELFTGARVDIENLETHVDKDDIMEVLAHFGFKKSVVRSVQINDGKAAIYFTDRSVALQAQSELDGRKLDGRQMHVFFCKTSLTVSKSNNSRGGAGGRGGGSSGGRGGGSSGGRQRGGSAGPTRRSSRRR